MAILDFFVFYVLAVTFGEYVTTLDYVLAHICYFFINSVESSRLGLETL